MKTSTGWQPDPVPMPQPKKIAEAVLVAIALMQGRNPTSLYFHARTGLVVV